MKRFSVFFLIFIITFILSNCTNRGGAPDSITGATTNSNLSETKTNHEGSIGDVSSSNITSSMLPPRDLSYSDSPNCTRLSNLWEATNGQYSVLISNMPADISTADELSLNINFFDYTLMQSYPLCNKPNCIHTDRSCNSYFMIDSHSNRYGWVFVHNNTLYVCTENKLFSMNPDGTDRKKVVEISDQYYLNNLFYVNGRFFIEASILSLADSENAIVESFTAFLNVDISTKECEEISRWSKKDFEINESILGIYGGYAYYLRVIEGKPLSGRSQADYDLSRDSARNGVSRINIETGEYEIYLEDAAASKIDYVQLIGNCIYYHSRQDETIYEIDLNEKKTTALITGLHGYCGVKTIVDDKLVYILYLSDNDFDKGTPRAPEKYYFNLKDKTTHIIKSTNGEMVLVYGIFQGDYIMRTEINSGAIKVGRISKTDFWNGFYEKANDVITLEMKSIKTCGLFGDII